MDKPLEKFQNLLRELFQFDCADLDFGIYRIMNHKRDVIERFIGEDLPQAIAEQLNRGALAEQAHVAEKLQEVRHRIGEILGDDAIDADGNLAEMYHSAPLGRQYLELKSKSAGGQGRAALEAAIFNHLYAFFSRYYQDGDFISKRRYSKRQRYAIPYNGEEVYLYWANSDQYYVKTAEHFRDYTFVSRGVTVRFELRAANVEQNNVQGAKRFFLPRVGETTWDGEANEVVIPFKYRPLTQQEKIRFANRNQQEKIIAEATREIPKWLRETPTALAALGAQKRLNSAGEPVSYLEHHLRSYTRRNTSDFFIHHDLKGFLSRELDFYLKSEVLNLDEMEVAGEERAEGWFETMRVIKSVGGRIIEFLDQIENFQKMLWEKRKFVVDAQHCVAAGLVPEELVPRVLECDAQWEEWRALGCVSDDDTLFASGDDPAGRSDFLKRSPGILLDTRHFESSFVDELLAAIGDIDDKTDGLAIRSENWQALNLLEERYREGLSCLYIDPPYNTAASAILYKNDYKDSSWLSLMADRLSLSRKLLEPSGMLSCAIDDEEASRLRMVMQNLLPREIGTGVVRSNPAGRKSRGQLSPSHEFALFFGNERAVPGSLRKTERELARYRFEDKIGRYDWNNLIRHGSGDRREDRPKMFFPIYVSKEDRIRVPKLRWMAEERRYDILEAPRDDEVEVLPVRSDGDEVVEKRWHHGPEKVRNNPELYRVRWDGDSISIDFIIRMDTTAIPQTWWGDARYASSNRGAKTAKDLFGRKPFDYPKAVGLVEDCLRVCARDDSSTVLDYFAGSGTTGHAVINLNREDGGRRKFILVELDDHFETVLLPRIKKVAFAPQWKKGKPKRMATPEEAERGPRIVKYMRLESYEDALNNIDFDESSRQRALQFDDYLLKYMLQWETRRSETLLNVEKLSRPFCYTLHIHTDGQARKQIADIPETFNYLLGLHVRTRRVHDDDGRRYLVYRGQNREGRRVVVIWRETEGWQKPDFERDKEFVSEQKLTAGADQIFVNGDSFIPKSRALEPVFKARMFAGVDA